MKKIFAIVMILAVVAAMVVPLAVSAASDPTGTSTITGDVGAAIELVAPSGFNLGSMVIGNNSGFSATNGVVKCNNPTGYNVTVASSNADGKMVSGPWTLGSALSVTTGSLTNATVTTSAQKCVTSSAPGTSGIALSATQVIAYTDAAVTGYSITLTYTATIGP